MRLSYPPIRVHIWGGLGSQLFAWAVLISLQKKFPRRRLVAVFHNGGVTRRESELYPYMEGVRSEFVQDYFDFSKGPRLIRLLMNLKVLGLGILRIPLMFLGFISKANDDKDFSKLKPWVLSLRGHYSKRMISVEISSAIAYSLFKDLVTRTSIMNQCKVAVHFRLGDLLYLETKRPITVENLALGIKLAKDFTSDGSSEVFVCSDSAEIALSNLKDQCPNEIFTPAFFDPRETVHFLMRVPLFIATPSKISEWATIFRVNSGVNLDSFLPQQMRSQMDLILEQTPLIHYY